MKRVEEHMQAKFTTYRRMLYSLLILGIVATLFSAYYGVWRRIPSTIMIKAGVEQLLDFHVPAKGEIYREVVAVSNTGAHTASIGLPVDLSKTVKVKANKVDNYKMKLKIWGMIPLKDVNVEVISDVRLRPAGIPIGIYVKTDGVLVVGIGEFNGEGGQKYNPGKYIFQTGDYIMEINDEEINEKQQLIDLINHSEGQEMVFKVLRGETVLLCKGKPELNQNGEYKMGIWVRDNAQGVGTMTYIDEEGEFGALGHGINDVDTSTLMSLSRGTLYHTEIIGITKGHNGSPGELTGFIEYDDENIMGVIHYNTNKGIFGSCTEDTVSCVNHDYLSLGLKQEIKKGKAEIICSLGGEITSYEVEIVDIDLKNNNVNRGIVLKITDPELLNTTGGIVQGMSGSPIIQNDRLIGAITHVLVQDPTRGYGIFIEEMLQ